MSDDSNEQHTVTPYIRAEQSNPESSAQAQVGIGTGYPLPIHDRHSPSTTTITPRAEIEVAVNPHEQNPVRGEARFGVNVRHENLTHQGGHRALEVGIYGVGIGGSHPGIGVEGSVFIGETAPRHGHPTEQVDEQTRVGRQLDEVIQHAMRGTGHGEKELLDTHTQQGLVEEPGHQDLAHEHIRLPGGVNTDAALDLPAAAAMGATSTPQVILRPDVESMPSSTSFIGIQDAHVLSPISLDPGADLMSPMGVQAGTHAAGRSEEPAEHSRPDGELVNSVSVYLRPDQELAPRVPDSSTSSPGHQESHISYAPNSSAQGGEIHVDAHSNVSAGEREHVSYAPNSSAQGGGIHLDAHSNVSTGEGNRAPAPGGLPSHHAAGQSADAIAASAVGHPIWIDPGAQLVSPMGVPASIHAAAHGKESPDRGDVGEKFSAEVWHGLLDQSAFHPEQHVVPLHEPFPPTAAPHSEANLMGDHGHFVPPSHQPAPHPGNVSANTHDHILQQVPDQTDHHFDGGNYH
jgi:hypothetical protein